MILILTMSVTTDGQFSSLVNPNLHHCRLCIDNVLNRLDNLEDVFAVYFPPILEPFNHIINELLCHLIPQPDAIILVVHGNRIDVQLFKGRRGIANLDGLFKLHATNKLLAIDQLQFRISVARLLLYDGFEVFQGLAVVKDSRVGKGAPPVRLS